MRWTRATCVAMAAWAVGCLVGGPAARAADWPQWGGTPSRNMSAAERGIPDTFFPGKKRRDRLGFDPATARNVRFIARLGSENYSAPVVAGGRIYIGTNDEDLDDPRFRPTEGGVFLCLDERTGALVWRLVVPKLEIDRSKVSEDFDAMNLGICSTATVDGDRVYLVTNRCEVLCLDADGLADGNDGPFRDEAAFSVPEGAAPVALGPADADILWRFDMLRDVLEEVWRFDCNPPGYRDRGGVKIDYWALVRGGARELDADGRLVSPSEIIGTPVVHGSRIYVAIGQDPIHGPGRGALTCIAADGQGDVTTTARVWQYLGIGRTLSTVSLADVRLGTPVWSVPTAANGTLFVASQKNLWAVATCAANPIGGPIVDERGRPAPDSPTRE